MAQYKEFEARQKPIVVATSLFRCGLDIEGVNIVLNYYMPEATNISSSSMFKNKRFFFINMFNFRLLVLVDLMQKV